MPVRNKIPYSNGIIWILIRLYFFLYVSFGSLIIYAQNPDTEIPNTDSIKKYNNMASFELGGFGVIYSLNYSRILVFKAKVKFICRSGFAFGGDKSNLYQYIFPFEFYLRSGSFNHHFELGSGITMIYNANEEINNYFSNLLFLRIGYSYSKLGSRFNYRIGFTPYIDYFFQASTSGKPFQPLIGISIGYKF